MKYFIVENNKQEGPFSIYELKDKGITSDVLVWAEGMAEWTPAWKVDELKAFLFDTKNSSVPPPVPPTANKAAATTPQRPAEPVKSPSCLKRLLLAFALLLAVLLVAMAVSCPNEEKHKAVIKEKVTLALEKSAAKNANLFGVGVGMVRHLMEEPIVDEILNDLIDYHNYVIFSSTTINTEGKDRNISYGAFGRVFTMNEDDLSRYIDAQNPFQTQNVTTPDSAAAPGAGQSNSSLQNTIEEEIIGSVGRIVKKQIGERTDSTTTEALEKIIDGVTDMLKQQIVE
ncbi:MAG: GYF domain-containing protein [Prevotella sp.]|nr:GYF domain-containing protein [Prevotella sp.]